MNGGAAGWLSRNWPNAQARGPAGPRLRHFLELKSAGGQRRSVKKPLSSADAKKCQHPYLDRGRPAKQKGGTLLAPELRTLQEHEAALANPDMVRPSPCQRCRVAAVHVHERRRRVFRGEAEGPPGTEVLIFRCADQENCGAIWRVLPAFLARHLWRRWSLVGASVLRRPAGRHRVARRTRQRWRARLQTSAAVLVALLGATGLERWTGLAARVGAAGMRRELIEAAKSLPELACAIDHGQPGVRVM